ncbi:unnamed protein product [Closterium sp. NIES-64]|nr:unnamed protein product [Closterium sp. NIES-64]
MHGVVHGTLGGTGDRVLDGLSQIWFIFILLDVVLTAATWIAGGAAELLVLSFAMGLLSRSDGVSSVLPSPSMYAFLSTHTPFPPPRISTSSQLSILILPRRSPHSLVENGMFLRDRPRFSRVDFSYDVFAEAEEEDARKQKALPPVVDVDATITDKH